MERFPGVSGDFEPGAEDPGDRTSCAGVVLPQPVYCIPGVTKRDDDNGWIPVSAPPASDTPGRPIAVMGVIDDPNYRANGEKPFADVVHYWQNKKLWTITHVCRGDRDADDFPVNVRCWQPIVELPPPWSALWA